MTQIPRWGNVCGSRSQPGWYITKPGYNLLSTSLQPADFLFDSTWPKIGNLISAGQASLVPVNVTNIVSWPTQPTQPLVVAFWKFSSGTYWRSASAIAQYDIGPLTPTFGTGFTGTLNETMYVTNSGLFFHATSNNTQTLQVRWRVYDRSSAPPPEGGSTRARLLLDQTGFYVTPPGVTAKSSAAIDHLVHPDFVSGEVLASGTGFITFPDRVYAIPFDWQNYSGEYAVYALTQNPFYETFGPTWSYDEPSAGTVRVAGFAGGAVRWAILK